MKNLFCKYFRPIFLTIVFILVINACVPTFSQYQQNNKQAEIKFEVSVPDSPLLDKDLYLEILDEITGLSLNPTRYQMERNEKNLYSITVPLMMDSVVKYRYIQDGTPPKIEHDSQGVQVRYRLFYVKSPAIIHDQITRWADSKYEGKTGTLQGYIYNESTNQPVSNVMVTIAGMRAFTGEDGAYTISDVPVGEQRLNAYHVDCLYQNFQQDAIIAENATTPANFGMKLSPVAKITFIVSPPAEHIPGAPVRLIGNLLSTGNTFMDLKGGLSTLASNSPIMNYQDDGSYKITLSLPAGCYFEYKYSLGDGFWNAEHDSAGKWMLRKLIIPSKDITIHDQIQSWKDNDSIPITLNITTPSNTPEGIVAVELNPFDWMEPLPIWNLGDNQWLYVLYSPINFIHNASFRILLDNQQGREYDTATQGIYSEGIKINTSQTNINYSVKEWAFD